MDSNKSIIWTLATPLVDRYETVRYYLRALNRIDLPRKQIHLMFVDLSKNPKINDLLVEFKEQTDDWLSVEIHQPDLQTFTNYRNEDGEADFLERRVAIANTMNYINKHRKGNLLIWEEDIIPPVDAFTKCEKLLANKDVAAVSACQYSRRSGWPDRLMAWEWEREFVFGPHDTSSEFAWSIEPLDYEKEYGFETVGATATGFILIKGDFLDGYEFDGVTDGQDVMLGFDINGLRSRNQERHYLVLNWEVKTLHIGEDNKGHFKIYKSPKCKLELLDAI